MTPKLEGWIISCLSIYAPLLMLQWNYNMMNFQTFHNRYHGEFFMTVAEDAKIEKLRA